MASFEKIVNFEKEVQSGVVRLIEANGFYRAYNHSAFLFYTCIAQHKVTRKFVKNLNENVVYLGFPTDKLLERIGGREHRKTEMGVNRLAMPSDALSSTRQQYAWRSGTP